MATEMVPIRSVKQYLKEFGEAIVKDHAKPQMVREQLLDHFQKEVFGQLVFKYGDANLLSKSDEELDDKTREGIRNIIDNANRKWNRLCIEFSKYKETYSIIKPGELLERLHDIVNYKL